MKSIRAFVILSILVISHHCCIINFFKLSIKFCNFFSLHFIIAKPLVRVFFSSFLISLTYQRRTYIHSEVVLHNPFTQDYPRFHIVYSTYRYQCEHSKRCQSNRFGYLNCYTTFFHHSWQEQYVQS